MPLNLDNSMQSDYRYIKFVGNVGTALNLQCLFDHLYILGRDTHSDLTGQQRLLTGDFNSQLRAYNTGINFSLKTDRWGNDTLYHKSLKTRNY